MYPDTYQEYSGRVRSWRYEAEAQSQLLQRNREAEAVAWGFSLSV